MKNNVLLPFHPSPSITPIKIAPFFIILKKKMAGISPNLNSAT
jgi:hypothetical protein